MQYEGAANEGGRGPSIWDIFTHQYPNKIKGGGNGDVAVDQYHRYKEDVRLMKYLGLDAYRFSISWSRILPTGKVSGGINKVGIAYYNNLINELLSKGLKPFVTLFHWDLPQALESEYGGFLSKQIIEDFTNFVDVCFKEFGDRVKHWITLNEPYAYAYGGYVSGTFPPGRCTKVLGNCTAGNSGTEPYVVAHNFLLSHASAVKLYKDKYQGEQKGEIGITLVSNWFIPYSTSASNRMAAQRALDFMFGWFMDPLTKGDYPPSMRSLVGSRLPRFTKEETQLVKGSFDFLGLNYYTTYYASNYPAGYKVIAPSYATDSRANTSAERNGKLIGFPAASSWLYMYPKGLKNLLLYIKEKYNNPKVFITENGYSEYNNGTLSLMESLKDPWRVEYYYGHLYYLHESIREGVDVRGYFAWSLLDNFEWADGYSIRFGLVFIDYSNGLRRHPKHSAYWLQKFLHA
ncbi:beta-glucosidase 12-like isoform X1 [Nymphaea colorata]|nr:beta-glucosidase 12-like isoform X1 [Nymphaea colorata]